MENYKPGQLIIEINHQTGDPELSSEGKVLIENLTNEGLIAAPSAGALGTLGVFIPPQATASIKPKPNKKPVVCVCRATVNIGNPGTTNPGVIIIGDQSNSGGGQTADVVIKQTEIAGNKIVVKKEGTVFSLVQS